MSGDSQAINSELLYIQTANPKYENALIDLSITMHW